MSTDARDSETTAFSVSDKNLPPGAGERVGSFAGYWINYDSKRIARILNLGFVISRPHFASRWGDT